MEPKSEGPAAPGPHHTAPSERTRAQARSRAERIGVGHAAAHFFLCTGPDCCQPAFGQTVWNYLKRRTAELEAPGGARLLRTKAACLRICKGLGPTMVVYPSGRWYHGVNEAACERVLQYELEGRGDVADLLVGSTCEDEPPAEGPDDAT
jgi:(2Fe-2S) ferredoxin